QRHPVVVRDQPCQGDLVRQKEWIIPGGLDRLGLDAWVLGAERHDEAKGAATPERHGDPMAGHKVDSLGYPVRVRLAGDPAGGFDRHLRVEGQPTSSAWEERGPGSARPSPAWSTFR